MSGVNDDYKDLEWAKVLLQSLALEDDGVHSDMGLLTPDEAVAALAEPLRKSMRVAGLETLLSQAVRRTAEKSKRIEELEAALRDIRDYSERSTVDDPIWLLPNKIKHRIGALLDTEAKP